MPEVHPLPLIAPNFDAFDVFFERKVRTVGRDASTLKESAQLAINVIDGVRRIGVCVTEEEMWDVVLCVEAKDGSLTVSESAMKQAGSLYGDSNVNGRMHFFTIGEAIAVGAAAANHWACTDECDVVGGEGRVVVAVVQGLCGHEPDMGDLNQRWRWAQIAESEAGGVDGFVGETADWVY
jgi:hypothetical protein